MHQGFQFMRVPRLALIYILVALFLLPGIPSLAQPRKILVEESILRDAGIATDGPALLEFLRKRTLDEAGLAKIQRLVKQLGDRSFPMREQAANELIGLGKPASPYLRRALHSGDPEIARRAEACLRVIDERDGRIGLAGVVARLIALRKPAGSGETLLAYIPFAENESVLEEVQAALTAVALPSGKPDPALIAALNSPMAVRRAAVAEALAGVEEATTRTQVMQLLKDGDAFVRLRTAMALVAKNEKAGVPVLIDSLDKLPVNQAWLAEDMLLRIAGEGAPKVALGRDEAGGKRCVAAWNHWWKAEGAQCDLKKRQAAQQSRGYTMLVLLDAGRVLELDKQDKVRLTFENITFPLDAQMLQGDRLLAAEYQADRVSERGAAGDIVWEFHIEKPLVAQRLSNGHTFMANEQQFIEVNREGKEIFNIQRPLGDHIMKARKLPNGEIACITSLRRFVRLDANGTELGGFPVAIGTSGGRIEVLPNGRVLVPEKDSNRVVEFDANGQIVWQASFMQPVAAVRLPNGNTLVTSFQDSRAVEIDSEGKEVWHYDAGLRVTRAFRR
jgi:PQQ-like domain